jgi:hypothetical protein
MLMSFKEPEERIESPETEASVPTPAEFDYSDNGDGAATPAPAPAESDYSDDENGNGAAAPTPAEPDYSNDENRAAAPIPSGPDHFDGTAVPFAESANDDMTFGQAFAASRQEVGPGGVFEWHGGVYHTYYANEWEGFSDEYRHEFSHYPYQAPAEQEPIPSSEEELIVVPEEELIVVPEEEVTADLAEEVIVDTEEAIPVADNDDVQVISVQLPNERVIEISVSVVDSGEVVIADNDADIVVQDDAVLDAVEAAETLDAEVSISDDRAAIPSEVVDLSDTGELVADAGNVDGDFNNNADICDFC